MKLSHKFWSLLKGSVCCLAMLVLLSFHNAAPAQALSGFNGNELAYGGGSHCPANPDWINNPSLPSEIPNVDHPNLCEFYQFSWQSFLYLMSPSRSDFSLRNFQDTALYPTLQVDEDSCSSNASTPTFLIRTVKQQDDSGEFLLPERIGQAGGGATIYDQNGNVVFYSISFGRDLCSAPESGNLPKDTIELKMAWKVLEEGENKDDYLSIEADVIPETGSPVPETLGLIGFHLVRSTPAHPEMIWATFDHKSNAPTCHSTNSPFTNGFSDDWSFLSPSCSSCLYVPDQNCFNSCKFNQAQKATSLTTATPSEICVAFPNGTTPNDNKLAVQNNLAINDLNEQLVGSSGFLSGLPPYHPLAVIKNYFNLGAIWLKDKNEGSKNTDNQIGSLQLANPVMETTFQGDLTFDGISIIPSTTKNMFNCFACHQYTPNKTATTGLSHIFDDIRKYHPLPSGSN